MDKALQKKELPKEYLDLVEIWKTQVYEPLETDATHYIISNPGVQLIFKNAPVVSFVFDLRTQQFTFISSNTKEIFGYDAALFTDHGQHFLNQIRHPADLASTWKLLKKIWSFIIAVPPTSRAQFKFNLDYRVVKPTGEEVRILEQIAVLQQDSKGNITHILGICNEITSWKKSCQQIASVISSLDHTVVFFTSDEHEHHPALTVLSKRELEIVRLLAQGYSSKCIADKLFISFHTVNTHRQHMIEKTKTRNTGELIQFASSRGLTL